MMHTNQTVEFGKAQRAHWGKFDKTKLTVMEAMTKLDDLVDESDPDCDVPNVYHAYQTAEGIRAKYPDRDWMILTGFLHDLGKMMCFYGQPQWCTVGDIYPVGCKPAPSVVYVDDTYNECVDQKDPRYKFVLPKKKK
jgi:inositol oxygenase